MIERTKFDIAYDEKNDILYIAIDYPKPAIRDEIEDGVLLGVDPDTNEIVGITIIGFKYKFEKKYGKDYLKFAKDKYQEILKNPIHTPHHPTNPASRGRKNLKRQVE